MTPNQVEKTIHNMQLADAPFEAIRSGRKTVEMRLNDERRRGILPGDLILFTHRDNGDTILVRVVSKTAYNSFQELYPCYDKREIGYAEHEISDPSDMLMYYTEADIARYGALAIRIELIK